MKKQEGRKRNIKNIKIPKDLLNEAKESIRVGSGQNFSFIFVCMDIS